MTLVRTREIIYGLRDLKDAKATTAEIELTKPVAGVTTQEDANQLFDSRITALETAPPTELTEIDCGVF